MRHLFRTVEALVILLIAVITTEVGGGLVPNAAADTIPFCSFQLALTGKGPEGPGYWTSTKAVKTCDRPSNVLVNYPDCTWARCRPGQKAQCNICYWVNWLAQAPAPYYVNDAGCLRYICDRLPRYR